MSTGIKMAVFLTLGLALYEAQAHNSTAVQSAAVVEATGMILMQKGIAKSRNFADVIENRAFRRKAPQVSCDIETKMRAALSEGFQREPKWAPAIVRAVFHDAVDFDNMLELNEDQEWTPMEGSHGGVDSCLLSTVNEDSTAKPKSLVAVHNAYIGHALEIVAKVCKELTEEGIAPEHCMPDAMVLGAFVAIENADGPKMTMRWGRKRGSCTQSICVKDTCDVKHALGFAPSLTAIDDPAGFRTAFSKLGFSAKEQVALMGAHTFGRVNVCGGIQGMEKGPFCEKPAKLTPHVTPDMIYPQCVPKFHEVSECWVNGSASVVLKKPSPTAMLEDDAEEEEDEEDVEDALSGGPKEKKGKKGKASKKMKKRKTSKKGKQGKKGKKDKQGKGDSTDIGMRPLRASMRNSGGTGAVLGFSDGGFWDQTPEKFDNEYFKLFAQESYANKDKCCGQKKNGECSISGSPVKIIERSEDGKGTKTEPLEQGFCDMKWCRSDRKGKSHMKSVTVWHMENTELLRKGTDEQKGEVWLKRDGVPKRIVRLAGDWALLHGETKQFVEEFANDEDAFKKAFAEVFEKVAGKSHDPLSVCTPSSGESSD